MSKRGVFAIDRGLFDHPAFKCEPFTEREAWIWMIGEAAWRPTIVRINRRCFELKRGQFVHAARYLAKRWQWSPSRAWRFLQHLKNESMIETDPVTDATVVTVCRYGEYQFGSRPTETPSETQADTMMKRSRNREEEGQEAKKEDAGGDARATPAAPLVSQEAHDLAMELAVVAGHDPEFLSPKWISDGPAYRVQMMLDTARAVMRKKRDGPPNTIRYFEPIFARAHAPPLPLPPVQLVSGGQNESTGSTKFDRPKGGFASQAVFHARRASSEAG
jgi:hypothetical protein